MDELTLRAVITGASPDQIYSAWVDGAGHAAMTGAGASSDPREGGQFTAWDGYITGHHVTLEPGRRLVQRWHTASFPPGAPSSLVDLRFEAVPEGTAITLRHTEIPAGQGPDYDRGWEKHYFAPMRAHFGQR